MSRLPMSAPEAAIPELRSEARIRDLEARIANLEGLGGAKGRLINVQRLYGQNEAYRAFSATTGTFMVDAAGVVPLALTYTPPVDCWWDVTATIGIVDSLNAVYNYMYGLLDISPNDVDNEANGGYQIMTQRSDVNKYGHRKPEAIFKLAAGTTYTVSAQWVLGTVASWQYNQGHAYLSIIGRAWAR